MAVAAEDQQAASTQENSRYAFAGCLSRTGPEKDACGHADSEQHAAPANKQLAPPSPPTHLRSSAAA